MKFFAKIIGSIAAILICLGLVVAVVGLVMGATLDNFHWGSLSGRAFSGNWDTQSISESYTDVTALDFDLGMAQVTFVEGDTFSIEASGLPLKITSQVNRGVWKVESREFRSFKWFQPRWGNHSPTITITLPEGFVADSLRLEMGMGRLDAQSLRSRGRASLEVGMGQILIDRLEAPKVALTCGMGSIAIDRVQTQEGDIDCGMGRVALAILGEEKDYGYTVDVGMGDVDLGSQSYSGLGQKTRQNQDAPNQLTIECGMGKVEISFQQD